jgi:hypothetical protein
MAKRNVVDNPYRQSFQMNNLNSNYNSNPNNIHSGNKSKFPFSIRNFVILIIAGVAIITLTLHFIHSESSDSHIIYSNQKLGLRGKKYDNEEKSLPTFISHSTDTIIKSPDMKYPKHDIIIKKEDNIVNKITPEVTNETNEIVKKSDETVTLPPKVIKDEVQVQKIKIKIPDVIKNVHESSNNDSLAPSLIPKIDTLEIEKSKTEDINTKIPQVDNINKDNINVEETAEKKIPQVLEVVSHNKPSSIEDKSHHEKTLTINHFEKRLSVPLVVDKPVNKINIEDKKKLIDSSQTDSNVKVDLVLKNIPMHANNDNTMKISASPKIPESNSAIPKYEIGDACKYPGIDPFNKPVETYNPPVTASYESIQSWKNEVDTMMKVIMHRKTGGPELREYIRKEVSRMQALRFNLFCKYV